MCISTYIKVKDKTADEKPQHPTQTTIEHRVSEKICWLESPVSTHFLTSTPNLVSDRTDKRLNEKTAIILYYWQCCFFKLKREELFPYVYTEGAGAICYCTLSNASSMQKPGKAEPFGGQSLNQSKALVKF